MASIFERKISWLERFVKAICTGSGGSNKQEKVARRCGLYRSPSGCCRAALISRSTTASPLARCHCKVRSSTHERNRLWMKEFRIRAGSLYDCAFSVTGSFIIGSNLPSHPFHTLKREAFASTHHCVWRAFVNNIKPGLPGNQTRTLQRERRNTNRVI